MKKRFNYANKKSNRLLAMKDNSKVKNVGVPEGIKIGHRHLKIKKNISAQGIKIESRSIHSTQAKSKEVDGIDFNKIKNIHVRKQINRVAAEVEDFGRRKQHARIKTKKKTVDVGDFDEIEIAEIKLNKNEVIVGDFDKIQRSTVDGDDIE